jgi:hypothetical protein
MDKFLIFLWEKNYYLIFIYNKKIKYKQKRYKLNYSNLTRN